MACKPGKRLGVYMSPCRSNQKFSQQCRMSTNAGVGKTVARLCSWWAARFTPPWRVCRFLKNGGRGGLGGGGGGRAKTMVFTCIYSVFGASGPVLLLAFCDDRAWNVWVFLPDALYLRCFRCFFRKTRFSTRSIAVFSRFLMLCLNAPWKALFFGKMCWGLLPWGVCRFLKNWGGGGVGGGGGDCVPTTSKHGMQLYSCSSIHARSSFYALRIAALFLLGSAGASAMANACVFCARP